MAPRGSHLVLVHGSYHGAWCWDLLKPDLEALGHRVTAVELPIGDPAAGAAEYAEAIEAQVDWSVPPVLVAHSMAGLVTPIVAGRRRVRQLVFLAAMLPKPGMSANEQRAAEPMDGPVPLTTAEMD
jgi:pimeloyl-ACP methyl ester carboxylesterase